MDPSNPALNEIDFSHEQNDPPQLTDAKLIFVNTENSDDTIHRVLATYDLGNKLRLLRLRKKISLVDLGKHTGLSASMLSQLENGKLVPTLPTLARIAMVFDVGLDFFFADRRRRKLFSVVRAGERMRFPDRVGNPAPKFFFEVLAFSAQEKSLQAYLAEFPQSDSGPSQEHFHDGAEFLFVLSGELVITYQGEDHALNVGDSVYFDSSEAHAYRGVTDCKAIVITTPPRM
jgi:transcriptional regulator with XRE-family HTH domain